MAEEEKGDCLAGGEIFRGDGEPKAGGHCQESD